MRIKLTLFLIIVFSVISCGCNGYTELNDRYIITALGVDYDKEVNMTAEIFITGDMIQAEPQRKILKAGGDTVQQAFYNLKAKLSKSPLLDHCTAVVIGEGVYGDNLKNVFEFCKKQESINLGVNFATCRNAEELLSLKSLNVAVGFDIVSAVDSFKQTSGVDFRCRHYEIESDLSNPQKIYTLPFFEIDEDTSNITASCIYNEYERLEKQGTDDSILYSVLCNKNSGDTGMFVSGEYADITFCRTVMDIKQSSESIKLSIKTKISTEKQSENFKTAVQNGVRALIEKTQVDIFGFLNRIEQKDHALFERIKGDYAKMYSDKKITIDYTVE